MGKKAVNYYEGFKGAHWKVKIDVRDFIQSNYRPYSGDDSFLKNPTDRTLKVLGIMDDLLTLELKNGGVFDIDTERVSSLLSFEPGYLDPENEIIVGLQTDEPLKRSVNPFGGIRMARQACEAYGFKLSDQIEEHFKYKTTHNDGVFRVYSDEVKDLRSAGVLTGLPDAYGRGRIIGDYRRVALYGVDRLIADKKKDWKEKQGQRTSFEDFSLLEEVYKQIDFLEKLKEMAKAYGHEIGKPARNAVEAVQWTYYGYLGAIKEQNGAAMSLGRVSTFLDIYIERDMENGVLNESGAQELIDDLVIKLRLARQLRTPDYNALFAGDPLWITESIGGVGEDGRHLVTKTSYRFLHTLKNLNPAPEPNMTILWSKNLPENFKRYCAKMSIQTDALQYENDDLMRPIYGDDYGIACCVSAMRIGKEMQYFGARCNLPKTLLLALNGGIDEMTGKTIGPDCSDEWDDLLDYEKVVRAFDRMLDWICSQYVYAMNAIHFMHDKYAYEKLQMALHDTDVHRFMAFGLAGLSVVADSLSAIKYARVTPIRNASGLIQDFHVEGSFPKYGNDDDRVDAIAADLVTKFHQKLSQHEIYRNAEPTLSVLTITSNVVYGKKTGATPDGRNAGEPFAPGANPMHGRELQGALASMNSVAKLPFSSCRDGISYTFSIAPETLGRSKASRVLNLVSILDGYFIQNGHHINVNVMNRDQLLEAMKMPEKHPNMTLRVSGYAVNFHRLSQEQQLEVLARTYHERM